LKDFHEREKNGWTCLTTVSNDIEFNILKGLLETADIPAIKKVEGLDGLAEIITGAPLTGIEVWVPTDRFDEAMQLLQSGAIDEEESKPGVEAEEGTKSDEGNESDQGKPDDADAE